VVGGVHGYFLLAGIGGSNRLVADGIGMLRRNNKFRIALLKKQAILPVILR
jgi:hypothetical protein